MVSYVTPKKGVEFIFYAGLPSVASTSIFQSTPTIAAGDFKVSIDGGALNNLATLPAVTPAASKMVKFTLSTSEMNGDNVTVVGSDAAGGEWKDIIVNIQTSARQIDDLAWPTTTGRSLDVTATGAAGIDWNNIENPTTTVAFTGSTIATTQKVDVETIKTNPVVNGGTITFPTGATLASTTNITGGTITTTTNLTNLPTIPADWLTAAGTAADFGTEIGTAVWAAATRTLTANTNLNDLDAAGVAAAVWNAATATYGTAGSYGLLIETNLDGTVTSRMATYTQPTGFLAATFPTTVASTTNITGGTITTVTNLTNAPTSGDLTATMKTSVNTEVLDVLNTDTFAEPAQGTPGATISLAAKLGFLYKAWRNKTTQTATTYSLFNDDAATVDHKSTTSDDGVTFTKTEVTSGP